MNVAFIMNMLKFKTGTQLQHLQESLNTPYTNEDNHMVKRMVSTACINNH